MSEDMTNGTHPLHVENNAEIRFHSRPKPITRVTFGGIPDFEGRLVSPRPNWWHRLWWRLLLGARFEEIEP